MDLYEFRTKFFRSVAQIEQELTYGSIVKVGEIVPYSLKPDYEFVGDRNIDKNTRIGLIQELSLTAIKLQYAVIFKQQLFIKSK